MKLTDRLITSITGRLYRVALGISAGLTASAWLLAWVAHLSPPMVGFVVCLSAPYLGWMWLPVKLVRLLGFVTAPSLLGTSIVPLVDTARFSPAELAMEGVKSILLAVCAGAVYAFLARLLEFHRMRRAQILWYWTLAQGVGGALTGLYLLSGHLVDAYGQTRPLGYFENIVRGVVGIPLGVVRFFSGQEPTLRQWGDFDSTLILTSSGQLAALIALAIFIPVYVVLWRQTAKPMHPTC